MPVNVAIVDDDAAILDAMQTALGYEGLQVRTYASGEAFLSDIEIHTPDFLILDPHLPGISGAEVAETIALRDAELPFIGLTARPASPIADAVLQAGARAVLTKPATLEVLIEHIRAIL